MKYTAHFINDEIVIIESENGIAFSKNDAIMVLSNSYSDRISYLEQRIKYEEKHILYLRSLIPELIFEQRKVENRKKYV